MIALATVNQPVLSGIAAVGRVARQMVFSKGTGTDHDPSLSLAAPSLLAFGYAAGGGDWEGYGHLNYVGAKVI